MPRAMRACAEPGCPQLCPAGQSRCARHAPVPWQGRRGIGGGTWQRLRRQVLARDEHTCQQCGAPATEVDHIVPRAIAPQLALELDNCRALCTACHARKSADDRRRGGTPSPRR